MENQDIKATLALAYETQHLSWHPRAFGDEIYNMFFDFIDEALGPLKLHLIEEFSDQMHPETIAVQTDKLLQDFIKRLDKVIDNFEVFINMNVFEIPSNVVLAEDYVQITSSCTKEQDEELDVEISDLKQKILEAIALRNYLKSKESEQQLIREELTSFLEKIHSFRKMFSNLKFTGENISFATSKCLELLEALK